MTLSCLGPTVEQPITPSGELGEFIERAPLALGARQETAAVILLGEMVVLGGFDGARNVVPYVESYNAQSDSWRRLADLPIALHHPNAAVVDDKIYVLGFLTGRTFDADGRAFVYNPSQDSWTSLSPLPFGTERGGGVAIVKDERIYIVGGIRGNALTTVQVYDPLSDSYQNIEPLPQPRDHLMGALIDERLVVVGGRERSIASHRPNVYIFDDEQWSEGATMLTSRAGAAAALLDDQLVVFGGEGNPEDPSGVFGQTESYDLQNDTWTSLSAMGVPRHGMGAATIEDVVYVAGGGDVQGLVATDVHESFSLTP